MPRWSMPTERRCLCRVGLVMHEYFPARYFKYILIIVSILVVAVSSCTYCESWQTRSGPAPQALPGGLREVRLSGLRLPDPPRPTIVYRTGRQLNSIRFRAKPPPATSLRLPVLRDAALRRVPVCLMTRHSLLPACDKCGTSRFQTRSILLLQVVRSLKRLTRREVRAASLRPAAMDDDAGGFGSKEVLRCHSGGLAPLGHLHHPPAEFLDLSNMMRLRLKSLLEWAPQPRRSNSGLLVPVIDQAPLLQMQRQTVQAVQSRQGRQLRRRSCTQHCGVIDDLDQRPL